MLFQWNWISGRGGNLTSREARSNVFRGLPPCVENTLKMTVFTPNLWKSTVLFQLTLSGRNFFLTPHMGLFYPRDYQCLTDSIRSSCYCNGIQFRHEKSYNQTLYCGSIWAKLKEISTTQWAVADFFSAIISEGKWAMNSPIDYDYSDFHGFGEWRRCPLRLHLRFLNCLSIGL